MQEIATASSLTVEQVESTLLAAREPVQIDELVGDEEDRPREDLLADMDSELPEQATSRQLLTEAVAYLLGMLPPREAAILQLRYGFKDGESHSMAQIGEIMGTAANASGSCSIRRWKNCANSTARCSWLMPWNRLVSAGSLTLAML